MVSLPASFGQSCMSQFNHAFGTGVMLDGPVEHCPCEVVGGVVTKYSLVMLLVVMCWSECSSTKELYGWSIVLFAVKVGVCSLISLCATVLILRTKVCQGHWVACSCVRCSY